MLRGTAHVLWDHMTLKATLPRCTTAIDALPFLQVLERSTRLKGF